MLVCPEHDSEVAFVAAIPFPLLRELRLEGRSSQQVLQVLHHAGRNIFFLYRVEHNKCREWMAQKLQERMRRAQHCLTTSELMRGLDSIITPGDSSKSRVRDHLEICAQCSSKFGWIKSQTDFLVEFGF